MPVGLPGAQQQRRIGDTHGVGESRHRRQGQDRHFHAVADQAGAAAGAVGEGKGPYPGHRRIEAALHRVHDAGPAPAAHRRQGKEIPQGHHARIDTDRIIRPGRHRIRLNHRHQQRVEVDAGIAIGEGVGQGESAQATGYRIKQAPGRDASARPGAAQRRKARQRLRPAGDTKRLVNPRHDRGQRMHSECQAGAVGAAVVVGEGVGEGKGTHRAGIENILSRDKTDPHSGPDANPARCGRAIGQGEGSIAHTGFEG